MNCLLQYTHDLIFLDTLRDYARINAYDPSGLSYIDEFRIFIQMCSLNFLVFFLISLTLCRRHLI